MLKILALFLSTTASAQIICGAPGAHVGQVDSALLQRPIEIQAGVGSESLELDLSGQLATTSKEAVLYYRQGLSLLYLFAYVDAVRSFNMAIRSQPDLVLAYLGLARSYLKIDGRDSAKAAINTAEVYAASTSLHLTDLEKTWLRVVSAEVNQKPDISSELLKVAPNDAEVLAYVGFDPDHHEPLNLLLKINPRHVGAHHFMEHIEESFGRYKSAQAHGLKVIEVAPLNWHAQHMLGHTLPMLGKWEEAEQQFALSDKLSRDWFQKENVGWENEWHFPHNLELYAMTENKLGKKDKAEGHLIDKCSITPARNCLELIDFYLTEQNFDGAEKVLQEKFRLTLAEVDGLSDAFWGEVKLHQRDVESAGKLAKIVADAKHAGQGSLRYMALVFLYQMDAKAPLSRAEQNKMARVVEKELAGHGFDTWSENLMAAERIDNGALAKGYKRLAKAMTKSIRKIDPDFQPLFKTHLANQPL